jgi:light-regulated signal transduction histidine kinase (bacteriophytochrome)
VGVSKIARDITERKKAEEALRVLNNQLESMVGERTRDLAAANRELEAFCYSVAHDLRSPLRGIDGFSQVLLKACEDRLSDPEKDYIKRIRTASQRMAGLIDGLLELARLARMELRFADVDMSGIAAAILEELRRTYPDRVVETRVARGLRVKADERLVRALLFNLLENAWKFTEKRSPARIEFGVMKEENISAFFVRDDGAGFDMAYVDKLFKPFERLHGAEFPGTGIGLATVQRIVQRHGGRVWAEGVVEKGAAFYFTLGDKNVPRTKRK